MKSLVALAAAAAVLAPAGSASAAPPPAASLVQLTGQCTYNIFTGTWTGYTAAVDGAVTHVTCVLKEGTKVVGQSGATTPGTFSTTTDGSEIPIFPNSICWSGWAHFSDGTFRASGPSCRPV